MSENNEGRKAKARPQSMIAQNFSLALDNVFGLDSTFELSQAIEDKKWAVNTQSAELEALEARLRATENRLRAKNGDPPLPPAERNGNLQKITPPIKSNPSSLQARQTVGATTPASRPGTAERPGTGKSTVPLGKKPVTAREDSDDDEEDTEEDEEEEEDEDEDDDSSSEESSSEGEERKK